MAETHLCCIQVQARSVKVLWLMSDKAAVAADLTEPGALKILTSMLSHEKSSDVLEFASLLLGNLAKQSLASRTAIGEAGAAKKLVHLLLAGKNTMVTVMILMLFLICL